MLRTFSFLALIISILFILPGNSTATPKERFDEVTQTCRFLDFYNSGWVSEGSSIFSESCKSCHPSRHCKERERLPEGVREDCIGCHMPRYMKINVNFLISDGKVKSASARPPHTSTPVGKCVADAVKRARFTKAKQSKIVDHTFAL